MARYRHGYISFEIRFASVSAMRGIGDIGEIEQQGRRAITIYLSGPPGFCVQAIFPHACNQAPSERRPCRRRINAFHPAVNRCACVSPTRFPEPLRGAAPTLGIELAHALDMAREAPFRDEGGDDGLRERGLAPARGFERPPLNHPTCVSARRGTQAEYPERALC